MTDVALDYINESLRPLAVPIGDLKQLSGNPRRGDVEAVAKSLKQFGQRIPITVQVSTNQITAGNHRFLAAKSLGWTHIAVVWVDESDAEAKAWALADNRVAQLGEMDSAALAAMIQEVYDEDADLLAAASYSSADIDALLADTLANVDGDLNDPLGAPEPESRPMPVKLTERFLAVPISVLNAREGWWQDRKRGWIGLGIESELGRDGKALTWNMALPPGGGHGAKPLVDPDAVAEEGERLYGPGGTSIFDPVLCELAYRWFSPLGGLVLDPFAGGSVRGIVASKLGRRYLGVDIRLEQVEANRVQAASICADGRAIVPDEPEDNLPDLTPVQEYENGIRMKREDLYAFAGVRGAKVRTCVMFVERAAEMGVGVVTAGARQSPQVNFVAQIAKRLGVPCRAHVPSGGITPELAAAKAAGAELVQHEAGYNTVIIARCREDAAKSGWVEIPYGMESAEAVTYTRPQVANIPDDVTRIINAVGSGMTLAGILWGLKDRGLDIPVVGVCVGHPPIDRLDTHAPPGWREMVTLIDHPSDYHAPLNLSLYGVELDPYYEAKCVEQIRPGDLLWVSAIRPTAVLADAPMPEWMRGDAADIASAPVPGKADLIFTCPPYGDLEVYSDLPGDLSNMDYPEFIEGYRAAIAGAVEHLNDDRFAVIVVGEFRDRKGFYRGFVPDTVRAFEDAGMRLYNEAILLTQLASVQMRAGRQFDIARKLGKSHQNCLVFVKGDPKRATEACGPVVMGDIDAGLEGLADATSEDADT